VPPTAINVFGPLPRLRDEVVMNPHQSTELPRAPVCTPIRRRLPRLLQEAGFHRPRQHGRRLPTVLSVNVPNSLSQLDFEFKKST